MLLRNRLIPLGLLAALALCLASRAAALPYEWPQWRGDHRDGVWEQPGLVEKFASPELKVRWRVPVGGGYGGPTVGGGRVFVMDRIVEPTPQERVHCYDWKTGRELWTHAYDCDYAGLAYPDGPRASVTIQDGRAYALGAVGNLNCLNAATGSVLWSKDLRKEYQIRMQNWGISAAPLVEGDLVILHVGGTDACLVALDRKTGAERWRALPDRHSYSAPIVIDQAGKRVVVCVTGDRIVGVDAPTGQLYWEYPWAPKQVIITIATPVVEKDRLFVTSFYDGAVMLRLLQDRPAVEMLWQKRGPNERATEALQGIISTALMVGDYVYGVDSYGELRCLDAKTGERLWESQDAVPRNRWANIHFVRNGDKVWLFNERGQLIIAKLDPQGYHELSRAQLIKPTLGQLPQREGVCWTHPAYAYRHVFVRNDEELICASLAAGGQRPSRKAAKPQSGERD